MTQMECYVFVDDSNLWIAGQRAQGKELKDTDIDKTFRIDLGKLLNLLTEKRETNKAFLYGSIPPPNDKVWKAAEEKNFTVKIFERSGSGEEKEVDTAMTKDIIKTFYTLPHKENVIFVIVTGDRDLLPPIKDILDEGAPVELWAWEHSTARKFKQLANESELFTIKYLDGFKGNLGYRAVNKAIKPQNVNPAHAIVYRDVPKGKRFMETLVDYLNQLMRLFYIGSVSKESTRDLFVEFPHTKAEVVLRKLRKLKTFKYQPCSFPEYTSSIPSTIQFSLKLTNRFEPLTGIDTDDQEVLVNIFKKSSLGMVDSARATTEVLGRVTEEGAPDKEAEVKFDDWESELRRKINRSKKRKEMHCKWGDHCSMAFDCPKEHSEEEIKLFKKFPKFNFKFLKTLECNKREQHNTPELKKWCTFAHDREDSWCTICKMYGHLTNDCKAKRS